MLPEKLKLLFGMVIDAKLISKRSYYLVIFGTLSLIFNGSIFLRLCNDETSTLTFLMLLSGCLGIMDAVIDSYVVEQARCHQKGPVDLQSFAATVFGISAAVGSVASAITIEM